MGEGALPAEREWLRQASPQLKQGERARRLPHPGQLPFFQKSTASFSTPVPAPPIQAIHPGMTRLACITALLLPLAPCIARGQAPDPQSRLCATNPAFSLSIMQSIIEAQLQKDHDPSLDAASPEQLAQQALDQGIGECATALRRDPDLMAALSALKGGEVVIGWDAYNTACDDRSRTKGDCIRAEVGAAHALKHMMTTDQPPGAKTLVETCQLVLQTDPTMTAWRECVDLGLAAHASNADARRCKLSVTWHSAKTGAEAGAQVAQCLRAHG